jgi:hypothetical protein
MTKNKKLLDKLQLIGLVIFNLVLLSAYVWNILIRIV